MSDQHSTTDEELMRLVKSGNRQGLSALMRRYANPLLTFLRRMTGDHHRGEELFQDVFLTIWIRRESFEISQPFRSWLFGIAANKCRTAVRTRSRHPVTVDSTLAGQAINIDDSPQEAALAAETSATIEEAVLQLPDLQRQVVVLRVWNGLSYLSIGEILGHSEGTARAHMSHALRSMRQFLEPRLRDRQP